MYDQPGAPTPSRSFENPWHVNNDTRYPVPQVFLAESVQPDGWVQILLPIRPNGSTGWVRASDVKLATNTYRIVVSLSAHQITVYNGASVYYQGPVATGAPATPTPTGNYFIRVPAAGARSEHGLRTRSRTGCPATPTCSRTSTVATARSASTATTTRPALGRSVSHGCIRMDNAAITNLTKVLPLGTPVDVVA